MSWNLGNKMSQVLELLYAGNHKKASRWKFPDVRAVGGQNHFILLKNNAFTQMLLQILLLKTKSRLYTCVLY